MDEARAGHLLRLPAVASQAQAPQLRRAAAAAGPADAPAVPVLAVPLHALAPGPIAAPAPGQESCWSARIASVSSGLP